MVCRKLTGFKLVSQVKKKAQEVPRHTSLYLNMAVSMIFDFVAA